MVHDSVSSLLESRDLFKDIIANPEKHTIVIVMRACLQRWRWCLDIRNTTLSMLH